MSCEIWTSDKRCLVVRIICPRQYMGDNCTKTKAKRTLSMRWSSEIYISLGSLCFICRPQTLELRGCGRGAGAGYCEEIPGLFPKTGEWGLGLARHMHSRCPPPASHFWEIEPLIETESCLWGSCRYGETARIWKCMVESIKKNPCIKGGRNLTTWMFMTKKNLNFFSSSHSTAGWNPQ